MAKEQIQKLVELIDKNAQHLPDFDYMTAMTLLQQLYNQPTQKEVKYVGYGPAAQQLTDEVERLKYNHERMKRSHKNKRKQWRETEQQLRNQVNELLTEIDYLESTKFIPKENISILEASI